MFFSKSIRTVHGIGVARKKKILSRTQHHNNCNNPKIKDQHNDITMATYTSYQPHINEYGQAYKNNAASAPSYDNQYSLYPSGAVESSAPPETSPLSTALVPCYGPPATVFVPAATPDSPPSGVTADIIAAQEQALAEAKRAASSTTPTTSHNDIDIIASQERALAEAKQGAYLTTPMTTTSNNNALVLQPQPSYSGSVHIKRYDMATSDVHPRRREMKKVRKSKTAAGVASGVVMGGLVLGPVGLVVGGVAGGVVANKASKAGERRAQRKHEKKNFQRDASRSSVDAHGIFA